MKLQDNFTTPEQSKRLLELGVPADSADCYYYIQEVNGKNICDTPNLIPYGMGKYGLKHWWAGKYNDRYTPCWSVGRLIEIELICRDQQEGMIPRLSFIYEDLSENGLSSKYLIESLIGYLESGQYKYDFSRLDLNEK